MLPLAVVVKVQPDMTLTSAFAGLSMYVAPLTESESSDEIDETRQNKTKQGRQERKTHGMT
eukprot:724846-Hanusia_phi.AAC.1